VIGGNTKLLGPWIRTYFRIGIDEYHRQVFRGDYKWHIYYTLGGWKLTSSGPVWRTYQEAMDYADKILIELGYTLLTKEQYDKLMVLV
jgi:hypothetical protein